MRKQKEKIGSGDIPMAKRITDALLPAGIFVFLLILFFCFLFRADNKTTLVGVTLASKPELTKAGVMDGSYQSSWGKWMNDNFYGNTMIVKCHNQLQYSLFHDVGVWVGKNGYLFYKDESYNYAAGRKTNTQSQDVFDQYAMKIAEMQRKLADCGKDFVYVITPSKSEVYPELLPWNERAIADRYAKGDGTSRDMLLKAFDKYGVNYYDTLPDLLNMKGTEAFDAFANTGHHWTLTAVATEMNTLFAGISGMTPHIEYPTVRVTGITDKIFSTDKDILASLNVFYPSASLDRSRPSDNYTFPDIEYDMSDDHIYWFGTSFGIEIMGALYGGTADRAFDSTKFSHYWTFLRTADGSGDTAESYSAETPHGETGAMRAVEDADLVVMDSQGPSGVLQTHVEFVDYVNSHLDTLLYRLGNNVIPYLEDDLGVSLNGFYALEEWGRWTNGGSSSVTLRGDIYPKTATSLRMVVDMMSYGVPHEADVYINSTYLTTLDVQIENGSYAVMIPMEFLNADENTIEINLREAALSPAEIGESDDTKLRGLGISSLILEEGV